MTEEKLLTANEAADVLGYSASPDNAATVDEEIANFKKWGAVQSDFNPRVLSGDVYMYRASDIELMWNLVESGKLHQAFDAYWAKRTKNKE